MTHELWNHRTRNLVASFDGEDAAWSFVRDALLSHGEAFVSRLALAREGMDGRSASVASGAELIERARKQQPRPAARPTAARPHD
jgi:hypothetical protein